MGKHRFVFIQTVQYLSERLWCLVLLHAVSWAHKFSFTHTSSPERTLLSLSQEIPQPTGHQCFQPCHLLCLKLGNFTAMLQPSICVLCMTFQALKWYGQILHNYLKMTSTPAELKSTIRETQALSVEQQWGRGANHLCWENPPCVYSSNWNFRQSARVGKSMWMHWHTCGQRDSFTHSNFSQSNLSKHEPQRSKDTSKLTY